MKTKVFISTSPPYATAKALHRKHPKAVVFFYSREMPKGFRKPPYIFSHESSLLGTEPNVIVMDVLNMDQRLIRRCYNQLGRAKGMCRLVICVPSDM